jgi:hypothetical protein
MAGLIQISAPKQRLAGEIDGSTSVAEVLKQCPAARLVFDRYGLKGCGAEHGPMEPLSLFAAVHEIDLQTLLGEIRAEIKNPSPAAYVYRESLGDFIYCRFFKAGIAITLTVGVLWGAINLLQIAARHNLLQLRLVPSIHAHAHAMIFGWVGLFVMGFAYQSFPRFKFTTLWRPDLANLSFILMLLGIGARIGAELLQPAAVGLGLGVLSAAVEFAAISLFVFIIFRTGRQSIEPRSPYESFIFGALFWMLVQGIFSDLFFFAKATAGSEHQLVRRIALLDGPLRDMQLFGFAALIIAGVSLRFVPPVYGLSRPQHERQRLLFVLINASLMLDVVSYVALLSSGNPYFAAPLEISYLLMMAWAVILVRQLGVFSTPARRDRSWKFIRAAYAWLLLSMAMMPLFMIYGALTHQVFSHAYWGAHRHAYTVGFVSLMIVGVASRVVPILAGAESERLSSLWGPFILLNAGCATRVLFQILTDFVPGVAYPAIGASGFVELTALAWWGSGLWRIMNLARTHRRRLLSGPAPLPVA